MPLLVQEFVSTHPETRAQHLWNMVGAKQALTTAIHSAYQAVI